MFVVVSSRRPLILLSSPNMYCLKAYRRHQIDIFDSMEEAQDFIRIMQCAMPANYYILQYNLSRTLLIEALETRHNRLQQTLMKVSSYNLLQMQTYQLEAQPMRQRPVRERVAPSVSSMMTRGRAKRVTDLAPALNVPKNNKLNFTPDTLAKLSEKKYWDFMIQEDAVIESNDEFACVLVENHHQLYKKEDLMQHILMNVKNENGVEVFKDINTGKFVPKNSVFTLTADQLNQCVKLQQEQDAVAVRKNSIK